MSGTKDIHKAHAVKVKGDKIIFKDNGWNPIDSCFLTEKQCRDHHKLPSIKWTDTRNDIAIALHKLADSL